MARLGAAVVGGGVGRGARVQAGVDEDPLLLGLDQVRRDRKPDPPLGVFALAPHGGGAREPADVEHLDLHGDPLTAPPHDE